MEFTTLVYHTVDGIELTGLLACTPTPLGPSRARGRAAAWTHGSVLGNAHEESPDDDGAKTPQRGGLIKLGNV